MKKLVLIAACVAMGLSITNVQAKFRNANPSATLISFNKNDNTAGCFYGDLSGVHGTNEKVQHEFCIPKESMNREAQHVVKGISLNLTKFINDGWCTTGDYSPYQEKMKDVVVFSLTCITDEDDTLYKLDVQATKEYHHISYASIDVCGPKISSPSGGFHKKLIERYGIPYKPNMTGWDDPEYQNLVPLSVRFYDWDDNSEPSTLRVSGRNKGYSRSSDDQSKCHTDTGKLWKFEIKSNDSRKFAEHARSLILAKQSSGDDF